eukprot:m.280224 g.280224  ORF g.280224 m.280224 type:complete len:223 (+) comp19822_c0_seq2:228-896(+)
MEADTVMQFEGEWDEEGVYFYQAFNDDIADWALEHQRFGGPKFKPERMTWIKPSFAWVLYRAGYGKKFNQNRILKIKLSHETVAEVLENCACQHGGGGTLGRVQWDPARDIMTSENGKEPRKMLTTRAIQIGVKGKLSVLYVDRTMSIEDVTELAQKVGRAHSSKACAAEMEKLASELPFERYYLPKCPEDVLVKLAMAPGNAAMSMHALGKGKTVDTSQIR